MSATTISRTMILALVSSTLLAAGAHAWPSSPLVNTALCTAAGDQTQSSSAVDDAGGAFVAWQDTRNNGTTGSDIYLTHVDRRGNTVAGWPANGLVVCNATGNQSGPIVLRDGSGGAYVVWSDQRSSLVKLYVTRVLANGTLALGWPANGKALLAQTGAGGVGSGGQNLPRACTDGATGIWVAWQFAYSASDNDVYAAHVANDGTIGGIGVGSSIQLEEQPAIAPDASGGAFVAYRYLTGGTEQIELAHVASNLSLGTTLAVTNLSTNQSNPVVAADGAGGVFVANADSISSGAIVTDIRHVGPANVLDTVWGGLFNVISVYEASTATDVNLPSELVPDGMGGLFVSWRHYGTSLFGSADADIIHLTGPYGVVNPSWPANGYSYSHGIIITSSASSPHLVADGFGGAIMTFNWPAGSGANAVQVLHFANTGTAATGWNTATPVPVSLAVGDHSGECVVSDGRGGALVFWSDGRSQSNADLYGQRIERYGFLGDPEPVSASVRDIPNDQGGKVRVSWNASYLDAAPYSAVTAYALWQQVPATTATNALRAGRAVLANDVAAETAPAGLSRYRVTRDAVQAYYWQLVVTQAAAGLPSYSLVAFTSGDSTGLANPRTAFMLEAYNPYGESWFADPDSGYSVDNLPPAIPAAFAGTFTPSLTSLTWNANAEPDLAGYRLYRGSSTAFVPGPGNLVGTLTEPHTSLTFSGPAYYKLSAIDIHGNESGFASLLPAGTLDVDDARPTLAFARISPTPTHGAASLHFSLSHDGEATLAIYDAQGRVVRELSHGTRAAGAYTVAWDGTNAAGGATSAGLYFARLSAEGRTLVQRLVLAR